MESKKELRREFLKKRQELSQEVCEENSSRISHVLFTLPAFRQAEWLYAYLDFRNEVKTHAIIERAWELKKHIALPRCEANGHMTFHEITSWEDVEIGAYGIREPKADLKICVPRNGVMLVPAVAFDRFCNRLGYGGGYYDRYVSACSDISYIGLAYELQIAKTLPSEVHDRKVDKIITEERIYDRFEADWSGCQRGSLLSE